MALASSTALAQTHEADTPPALESLMNSVSDAPPTASFPDCDDQADKMPIRLLEPPTNVFKKRMQKWRCTDLFSLETPKRFAGREPGNWWPACSAMYLEDRFLKKHLDIQAAASAAQKWVPRLDICAAPPAQNRYSESYQPPSQDSRKLRKMTDDERAELQRQIDQIRDGVTSICCAGASALCADTMKNVVTQWCKPQEDSSAPDSCIDNGTHFNRSPAEQKAHFDFLKDPKKSPQELKRFPLAPGFIQLSPFLKQDGTTRDRAITIAHEFGHACSAIRRQLEIQNGNEPVKQDFRNRLFKEKRCILGQDAASTYRLALGQLGLSQESVDCLLTNAHNADRRRFEEGPCEGHCFRSYPEESYANFVAIFGFKDDDWFPTVFPDYCYRRRDGKHPLMMDEIACFMKSPTVLNRTKKAIGCKE